MNDDLPTWLRAGGFEPVDDTTDWDDLAAVLLLPEQFQHAVDFATSVLTVSDPWGDLATAEVRLTDRQRDRLEP